MQESQGGLDRIADHSTGVSGALPPRVKLHGLTAVASWVCWIPWSGIQPQKAVPHSSTGFHRWLSGAVVKALQQFLADLKYVARDQVTGTFGEGTKRGVIAFQKQYNVVPAEGFVGPLTKEEIVEALNGEINN